MDLESTIKRFKQDEEETSPDALLEYLQTIENFFGGDFDLAKLDSYLGLTFPDSNSEGLYGFLRRRITDKKYEKVKERCFNLIQFILVQKSWRADVDRFCLTFKTIADIYWKQNKEPARIQQAALDCLIALFENFGDSIDSKEFSIAELFWDLLPRSEKSSFQPTVRGKMFHLLGIIGALGEDSFMKDEHFNKIFRHMISVVKSQVESTDAHLEVSILHGCMKGLDSLLDVYMEKITLRDPSWLQFQEYLEQIVNPKCSIANEGGKAKLKRREFQRAALNLVANHGSQLKHRLLQRHKQWYRDLITWAKSSNSDDHRVGRRAVYKFLEVVIEFAKQVQHEDDSGLEVDLEAFYQFFKGEFRTALSSQNINNRGELGIAVRGYGMLATLCSERNQSVEMLELMIGHINGLIQELENTKIDRYSPVLGVLPTYLESVASILSTLPSNEETNSMELSENDWDLIKKLAVSLIRFYPDMNEKQRNYCHISVQKLFDTLWTHHHKSCEPFIEQVYQQSFLHIVSCPTRAEIDILVEAWKKSNPNSKKSALSQLGVRPVISYVRFWKLLFSRDRSNSADVKFDLLMKWILNTVNKLDLSINFEDADSSEISLDPIQGATATTMKDFQIFVNIVDFFQELMASDRTLHQKFEKWIPVFSYEMLSYTKSNTFVSGFYKILSIVFDASRSIKYFEQEENDRVELHKRLNVFFRDLGTKIREYRDDLLYAVLELWLSLPDAIILSNITALNQTLQTVFTIGRNSFTLAAKGIDAVERWFFKPGFPVEEIKIIINNIYPILKSYFIFSELSENLNENTKPVQKQGDLKNRIKKNIQYSKPVEEVTLKAIQLKILQFLGSFGQYLEINDFQHSGLHKERRFLLYAIPFQESKPEFYLDDVLPRVLELCENSVERQTRISACEFFHTICLYFIGLTRDDNCQERLFRKVFQAMLKLGCDSDITVRQLFNPLCLQTIHWFTRRFSPYDLEMLGSITDALSQHQDLSLRELAAVCIGEYFIWTLKHRVDRNTVAGKDVLKTIFAMSTHASPDYRQGSVLAFNSIYRDFREEDKLVNEFTFNLLFSFLTSLKLSNDLPNDCLLIRSTKQSIRHLERILSKKKDSFNTALNTRQFKPALINKIDIPVLRDVVDWLITQGGDEASVYRDECLRLVDVLAKLVKEYKTLERCLTFWEEKKGIDDWISIAEQSINRADKISFLDAASSFYQFLSKNEILRPRVFDKNNTHFWSTLLEVCGSMWKECSEEDKLRLLEVFGRLSFSWKILDESSLAKVWGCALELSKEVSNIADEIALISVGKIIGSGIMSDSLKASCIPFLLFNPIQEWESVCEQGSELVGDAIWYRVMAEEQLMTLMLPNHDVEDLREKLWDSVNTALFKQLSSNTGPLWEANAITVNGRKILKNYLIASIFLGFDTTNIVDSIFDATAVFAKEGSFNLSTTKGRVFQKELLSGYVYCNSIFDFDKLLAEKPIADVGELIQCLLELLKTEKSIRNKFGKQILDKALTNWKVISINCDLNTTLKIFQGLLAVSIDVCKNSEELMSWWSRCVRAPHLDLKQKASIFGYIKVFAMSKKAAITTALTETIFDFIKDDLKPRDIPWVEAEQSVSFILRKLLNSLTQTPMSPSRMCLDSVLNIVLKVNHWLEGASEHDLFHFIKSSMERIVQAQQTDNDRKDMASGIYELITAEQGNKSYAESANVWRTCLLPVVSSLNLNATKKFFEKYIYDIIKKMDIDHKCLYDLHLKVIAINLLELMVYQTNSDFIKGRELANAYWKDALEVNPDAQKGLSEEEKTKVVYRNIARVCIKGVIKTAPAPPSENPLRKPTLAFKEACYNTLAATLLETHADLKFFEKFMFPGKKLFEHLNDENVKYEFPVVISEENHKAGITSYRRRKSEKSATEGPLHGATITNLLLNSQNLSGSSLAPEAASYDFTANATLVDSEFYQRILGSNGGNLYDQDSMEEVKLEWNEINEHGCMYAYVECLRRVGTWSEPVEKIEWPETLERILRDTIVHKNVKIFLVGGIINTPESLKRFAGYFTDPIIQLVLSDTFGSVKLNHFVQDVLLTLLSWHDDNRVMPRRSLVLDLLKYIFAGIRNEAISTRRDITKYILNILQNVVRCWVTDINMIPYAEIFSLGDISNPTEERSLMMLEVCLHVLLGGQLPHKEVQDIMKIFKKALGSRFKGVYTTAAKCIGLVLKKMKEEAPSDITEQNVASVVTKLLNAKTKTSLIEMIASIQEHFPDIMVKVRDSIFELIQQKRRVELITLLPLLLQHQINETFANADFSIFDGLSPQRKCADDFFVDIDGRGLFKNICEKDQEIWAGLDLFDLLIKNCTRRIKLLKMMDWLSLAEVSPKNEIRLKFASCLLSLYKEIVIELSPSEPLETSTKDRFLQIFIRLFDDEFEPIREEVKKFWSEVLLDWGQTSDLLLEIFNRIGPMKNPLNVCLGLILQRCQLSPDYLNPLFPGRLEDVQFIPFELDTSWRLRNSSFQPLFAESLSSVKNFATLPRPLQATLLSQRRSVGRYGMNMLQATLANLQFTPTQNRRNDFDTFSFMGDSGSDSSNNSPSSPVSFNDGELFNNSNNEQSNENNGSAPATVDTPENPILKLRRKFYERRDYTFYAMRTSEQKEEVNEIAKELEKARVSGVKTVRSYRIGELPDINIKHEDLLKTLLKLAILDHTLGKQFLLHLYEGFVEKMDVPRSTKYLEDSKEAFENVLSNSSNSSEHTLLSLMIEICVRKSIPLSLPVMLNLCQLTNSQKLGILHLEQQLGDQGDMPGATSSKRLRSTLRLISEEEEIWIGLAEMYKEIEEFDVLRNIFDNARKISDVSDYSKRLYEVIGEALHSEGLGSLEEALNLFESAFTIQKGNEDSSTETAKMFLEDSMLQCLTKLGRWSTLYEKTEKFSAFVASEDLIKDKNTIERLMPLRMKAGMQLSLRCVDEEEEDEEHANAIKCRNKFHEFLEDNLVTEEGTSFFTGNYPFDLAMWLLAEDEVEYFPKATLTTDRGYEAFIVQMKQLNLAPIKKQKQLLTTLQQAATINDFLTWKKVAPVQVLPSSYVEDRTTKLLSRWRKHLSFQPFDLIGNDIIASHRDCLASKIGIFLQEQNFPEDLVRTVQEFRIEQEFWLGGLGIAGKNFYLTQNCLIRIKKAGLEDLKAIDFRKLMARFLSKVRIIERNEWCKKWCVVWRKLGRCDADSEVLNIKADLLNSMTEVMQDSQSNLDDSQSQGNLSLIIKALNGDSGSSLSTCIWRSTEDLLQSCGKEGSNLTTNVSLYSKLFLLLKKLGNDLNVIPETELAEKMLCCVMRGCTEGKANDMLLLSNLFSLLKKFPTNLNSIFDEMSTTVPSYMYLPWIDQIMTAYKSSPDNYPSFKPLIARLVAEFPQAFQLQYSEHLNDNDQTFARALKALVLPFQLHKNRLEDIMFCKDEEKLITFIQDYQIFLQEIINDTSKIYGEMHKDSARKIFENLDKLIVRSRSSSPNNDSVIGGEEFVKKANMCANKAREFLQKESHRFKNKDLELNMLSPFLADFHFFEFAAMEKPGLYENFRKPKVQDHPIVVSFHPTVRVYSSLTLPLKLTIITNDGKRSHFLAKLGDDLRQDRRIQQLFKMSNVLFQDDVTVSQRNLSIETYSCIPLTPEFGIIEMVENTIDMGEMIFDTLELKRIKQGLSLEYVFSWLNKYSEARIREQQNEMNLYLSCAKMAGRQQAETSFDLMVSKLKCSLLRDNIRKRSRSYSEYFSIRQNMIKSYGALCMVHWLLGIGDRHLENTLVSLSSGKVVGIDFGRAFGTSNYVIRVPEMVPFRLTPQLQQLMMPYSYKGIFRESCVLTWNCLVEAQETILTVADVFIQEPSVDWLKLRQTSKSAQEGGSENAEDTANDDEMIIDDEIPFPFKIMKEKLRGCNPTALVVQELKMNNYKPVPAIYCGVVQNGRIHSDKDTLTTEEYVDALLDLATDKNILMRIFKGWSAWV